MFHGGDHTFPKEKHQTQKYVVDGGSVRLLKRNGQRESGDSNIVPILLGPKGKPLDDSEWRRRCQYQFGYVPGPREKMTTKELLALGFEAAGGRFKQMSEHFGEQDRDR